MKRILPIVILALVVAAGACRKSAGRPADTALNSDLSLTAQQRNWALDSAERAGELKTGAERSTHRLTAGGEVVHTRSTSSGASHSDGTITEKHTRRDAAIGAAAGAVVGATTSRSKVKGGVIGAAIGALLGGVIGNNVDKTKKKP